MCYTPSAVCIDADGLGKTFQLESVDAGHARSLSPVFFFFFFFSTLFGLAAVKIYFISEGEKEIKKKKKGGNNKSADRSLIFTRPSPREIYTSRC